MASRWSIASEDSVLSIASRGSVLSIGSIMSAASGGSVMASDARNDGALARSLLRAAVIGTAVAVAVRALLAGRRVHA